MALVSAAALTAILAFIPLPAAPQPAPLAAIAPRTEPGVVVTFTSIASGQRDDRHDRLLALAVPAGTPPSSLLPGGAFRAAWDTNLTVPLRSEYSFSFQGSGTAELRVNGQVVLAESGTTLGTKAPASVLLNQGPNRIQVAYSSAVAGADSSFRLLWSGKDFGPEPLSPSVLSADVSGIPLRAASRVREGRELFASLNCNRCHATGLNPPFSGVMPEMIDQLPLLTEAGARFRPAWIASWILDPKSQRPDATMPRVHLGSPQEANDIAAFLGSLGTAPPAAPPAAAAIVNAGGRLFAELRCIACHTAPGSTPDAARTSLSFVPAKWHASALADYLRAPQKNHPASRMPDFRLSAAEARQVAAFLLSGSNPAPAIVPGDVERGRTQYIHRCLDCHGAATTTALSRMVSTPDFRQLVDSGNWTRGCLAEGPAARGMSPDFGLDAAQRDRLRAYAASDSGTHFRDVPAEFSRRAFVALNCAACHDRDQHPAGFARLADEAATLAKRSGAVDDAAEGQSLSQDPPSLTWAGEKLLPDALLKIIAGTQREPARPWLKARMPGFGSHAAGLAQGLALEHGLLPGTTSAEPDPGLAEIGERLVGAEFFACVTCHAVGETPPLAPFGAPGINFALVPGRLRGEYFRRWMDYPQRIDPTTKMPRFTGNSGRSLQPTILDGDAHAQWEAILSYLRTIANP